MSSPTNSSSAPDVVCPLVAGWAFKLDDIKAVLEYLAIPVPQAKLDASNDFLGVMLLQSAFIRHINQFKEELEEPYLDNPSIAIHCRCTRLKPNIDVPLYFLVSIYYKEHYKDVVMADDGVHDIATGRRIDLSEEVGILKDAAFKKIFKDKPLPAEVFWGTFVHWKEMEDMYRGKIMLLHPEADETLSPEKLQKIRDELAAAARK